MVQVRFGLSSLVQLALLLIVEVLSWNAANGQFEWVTHTTGGAASYQVKWDAADAATYLEDKVPPKPSR